MEVTDVQKNNASGRDKEKTSDITLRAVQRQLAAMGCEVFEVGVLTSGDSPRMRMWPAVGRTMPSIVLIKVVLPAPLGPTKPKAVPRSIRRFTLFNARCFRWPKNPEYVLLSPTASMALKVYVLR